MSLVESDICARERDSRALGSLFHAIISDMKGSTVVWEDFSCKAAKLHAALRSTIVVITSFLDAFQKVADLASASRGATRDIGTALTRLCVRHRSIETKLRAFVGVITDTVVEPIQMRLEEWKKTTIQLEKDHAKDCKKIQQDIKKASVDTMRLEKRSKKGQIDLNLRLENAVQDVHSKYILLEDVKKQAIRSAMIEERSRFCLFISFLKPFMEQEMSLLTEITHLQEIVELLLEQTADPTSLPDACERVILDLKGSDDLLLSRQSMTGSPLELHLSSHRSSSCSINSSSSCSMQSVKSLQDSHADPKMLVTSSHLQVSGSSSVQVPSTLSQDCGYVSQDFMTTDFVHDLPIRIGDSSTTMLEDARAVNSNAPAADFRLKNMIPDLPKAGPVEVQSSEVFCQTDSMPEFVEASCIHVDHSPTVSFDQDLQQWMSREKAIHVEADDNKGDASKLKSSMLRSFSLPTQGETFHLPDAGSEQGSATVEISGKLTNSIKGFELLSVDTTPKCAEDEKDEKSMTLPRMPPFKVPLMPTRFSSTLSRKSSGPPTLPKRSSSKISSVKPLPPPPPMRCNSMRSASMEQIASSVVPVSQNSSENRSAAFNYHVTDSGKNLVVKSKAAPTAIDSNIAILSSPPTLRQQAPPADDCDQLLLSSQVQSDNVIPLNMDTFEHSFCEMRSSTCSSIILSSECLSSGLESVSSSVEGSICGAESTLELIKQGVPLRQTQTNDRSAPRIAD